MCLLLSFAVPKNLPNVSLFFFVCIFFFSRLVIIKITDYCVSFLPKYIRIVNRGVWTKRSLIFILCLIRNRIIATTFLKMYVNLVLRVLVYERAEAIVFAVCYNLNCVFIFLWVYLISYSSQHLLGFCLAPKRASVWKWPKRKGVCVCVSVFRWSLRKSIGVFLCHSRR